MLRAGVEALREAGLKLIVVTLSGGNRESDAPNAWRSVAGIVDHYHLIDTGESAQEAIRVALEMPEVRDRCSVSKFPGEYGPESCAEGRTFSLRQASELATERWPGEVAWALMLDTDETLAVEPDLDLRGILSGLNTSVALTWMEDFGYPKERFFRLPVTGSYTGRVHECYTDSGRDAWAMIGGVVVREKPKTPAETDAIMARVRKVCLEQVIENKDNQRAWMYLGNALCHFGDYPLAKYAFQESFRCSASDDQRGWMAFKVAAVCHELKDWDGAIQIATDGMRYAPHHPELPWACAYAEWSRDNIVRASAWADLAIMLGAYSPLTRSNPVRAYARFPSAAKEGPWQIRCACFQRMGDSVEVQAEVRKAFEMVQRATEGKDA